MRLYLATLLTLILLTGNASAISTSEVVSGVNAVRASKGLNNLFTNASLNRSAGISANFLCRNNAWYHTSYVANINGAGYWAIRYGENLAYGFKYTSSVINGWVNSPTHYANIVRDYQDIGTAVVTCSKYQGKTDQIIVVNHFGQYKHTDYGSAQSPKKLEVRVDTKNLIKQINEVINSLVEPFRFVLDLLS